MTRATLYAAIIICNCQQRLAIVDTGRMVNNAQCSNCGRQYQVMRQTKDDRPGVGR